MDDKSLLVDEDMFAMEKLYLHGWLFCRVFSMPVFVVD